MIALFKGNEELVALLLKHNADVMKKDCVSLT